MARTNSPLRYPGGKSCLLKLTSEILRLNRLERGHYAEPYAGGGGLALSLLYGGFVAEIHINDIDRAVWSFWHCILNRTDEFLGLVRETPVTINEWQKQRNVYKKELADDLRLGFSTFFLNRTNRSGIVKDAGVIGGLDQSGPYKIDCRYNVDDLVRRISRVHKYKDRINLFNMDAIDFIEVMNNNLPKRSLIFIDPPYFKKGSELYTSFYRREDHAAVADKVIGINLPWVVTYDNAVEISNLYRQRRQYSFDISYSVQEKRVGTELLIASKGLAVPAEFRDRQVFRPQYRAA